MKQAAVLLGGVLLLATGTPSLAQDTHAGHGAAGAAEDASAAAAAYAAAMEKMHRDMDVPTTGDPDVDFVQGMIPHHQGAIDMAKVALQHGKDAQIKEWAAEIIATQEREIAEMTEWLAKNRK